MSTPITEKEQYSFPAFDPVYPPRTRQSSDEDSTVQGEPMDEHIRHNHLKLQTSYVDGQDHLQVPDGGRSPLSPSEQREESRRLDDELELLRIERVVSNAAANPDNVSMNRSRSMARSRSRTNAEPVDDFDIDTTPIHEKTKIYQPPANPATKFAKFFKKIHNSFWLVRYFCYIAPLTILLLLPMLLGALVFNDGSATVGGVELFWFSVWLEIVWLTLWAGRILAKCLPWPMGVVASLFTNSEKKWRDLGKALEIPATLFFWWLAIEVSFLPTMINHHYDGDTSVRSWESTVNKIIVSVFIATILNFIEKIIIQLIAISFHLRTYADRIELNKFQIGSLVKLYTYSKEKIAMEDSEFEQKLGGPSGDRTPMAYINKAGKGAKKAINKVGDVAGKVAGDFTGRAVKQSTHPNQVILQLLSTTAGSQVLARRLYRTYTHEDSDTVYSDDLRPAFDNDDEADAAFTMFDKDLNGDISMEELEAVCVEVGRERKAISASLKDLDSVVSKLDGILIFVVAIIVVLVFISLISTSASAAITSAGSAVLAFSWLFSATAQEFLQSIIFVFVKHPFDVGDRVKIYGNTGSTLQGDDYFVKEISLLFTEFKKMEGHVVQAPNSYLNTLFILNQRRSGGLAEAVPVTVKFGTTLEQFETLRNRLLEFVGSEKREYQHNILTEITTVYEAYSVSLNVVFFYKSNWQNELLRLQRRNKFICALMVTMQDLGIEGPRQKLAGQSSEMPMYLHNAFPAAQQQPSSSDHHSPGPRSGSLARDQPFVPDVGSHQPQPHSMSAHPSILRKRGESISQMGKRVDFSLGMSSISSGADMGDVYDDERKKPRLPNYKANSPSPASNSRRRSNDTDGGSIGRTTSHDSNLERVPSGASGRTHRNRFFSRNRSKLGTASEGTNLEDLEAGVGPGVPRFSMGDMPDIPESSGTSTSELMEDHRNKGSSSGHIDPRTGIVSPQAVVSDSALERGDLPTARERRE